MTELEYATWNSEYTDDRRFDNAWVDLDRNWQNKTMEG